MKTLIEFTEEQIADVKYLTDGTLTICIITTTNDFKVTGESNVVDPNRYDKIKGMEISHQKAFAKLVDICSFYYKNLQQ